MYVCMINGSKEIFISSNYEFFNCQLYSYMWHSTGGDIIVIDVFSSGADDFNVPRLVLNQFRWLDCIIQSKVIKIVIFKIFRRRHVCTFIYVYVINYWKIDKS